MNRGGRGDDGRWQLDALAWLYSLDGRTGYFRAPIIATGSPLLIGGVPMT